MSDAMYGFATGFAQGFTQTLLSPSTSRSGRKRDKIRLGLKRG